MTFSILSQSSVSRRMQACFWRLVLVIGILANTLTTTGCAYVQGARVKPEEEPMHHPDAFWVGFALNPINSILWVMNRVPLPFLEVNTLPMDDELTVKGFRYYLPKPFLFVHQDAPGAAVKTDVLLLPNPREQYAIAAWASLGSQSLEIQLGDQGENQSNNHILKKLGFEVENTAVFNQLLTTLGNVGEAGIQQIGEGVKEAQTKLVEARKEEEAARQELAEATAAVQKIKTDTGCTGDNCLALPEFVEANKRLVAAQKAYKRAQNNVKELERVANPFDQPTHSVQAPTTGEEANAKLLGPALFEIRMENGGVELHPVEWVKKAPEKSSAVPVQLEIPWP